MRWWRRCWGLNTNTIALAKAAVAQFLGLLAEGKLDAVTLGNLEKANDRSLSAKLANVL